MGREIRVQHSCDPLGLFLKFPFIVLTTNGKV